MPAYSDNGLALRWDEDQPAARLGLAGVRRAVVGAAPPHPSNVVHGVYRVDGGPELAVRGFPLAQPSGGGEQPFGIDFPPVRDGALLTWRPVLSRAGRRLDPRDGGLPDSVLKAVPVEAPAALSVEPKAPARFPYQLEFLARVTVPLEQPPIMVGKTPDGLRIVFPLGKGGTIRGPKMNGTVEHVGGDWMRVREDGIGVTAIRAIITMDDGATLQSEYSGFVDFGADGQAELAAGRGPQRAPLNLTPKYLTQHPRWQWLNRLQCVAFGVVTMRTLLVEYDLYAMHSEAAGEVR